MTGYYQRPALDLLTDLINRSQSLPAYLKIKASNIIRISPILDHRPDGGNTELVLGLRHPSPAAITNCGRTIEPAVPMSGRTITLTYRRLSLADYFTRTFGGGAVVPAVNEFDEVDQDAILPWLSKTFDFDTSDAHVVRGNAANTWRVEFPADHPVWFEGADILVSKVGDIRTLISQRVMPYLTLKDLMTVTPARPVSQLVPNWKMAPMLRLSDLSFPVPDRELSEFIPNAQLDMFALADLQRV